MTQKKVEVIPATKRSVNNGGQLKVQSNIRVAAYCRVSTGDESQQTSYTTQKAFYTNLITNKPGWRFAGIYADEAKSGTSREHREDFNRMMADALDGKLDYIVTKSISRFARNTVDTLNCVRQLRQQNPPVGVYFEKENIDTLDATGELILTILSALAQDESRSISDNIRWSIQKNFQAGKPKIDLNRMLGYDKGENGEWVINPEQAKTVRYIFERYVCGQTANRIAKELNELGRKTVNKKNWSASSVLTVLRNEKYVGDIEMQKTITKDFLTHRSTINKGEAPRYYVENHHVGIIPIGKEQVSKVSMFKEKPTQEVAKDYIAKGALWNGGVFAFKLGYVLNRAHELIDFVDYEDLFNKYDTLNKISFDYAVVEHEPEIEVMRFAGTWKDLGTWNTLTEAMDSHAVGEAMFNEKCENVHVVNELDVPILCMGLKDVVVSASPEGILVSDKEQSSYIKPYVNTLDHRVMFAEKSWGSFKVIDIDKASMTIKVTLNAGHQMNYHSHQHRDEVWTVIAGKGKTVVDGMEQNVKAGDVITMSAGCRHTVIAETELKLIEVQLGEAIDVHDKQKFELEY